MAKKELLAQFVKKFPKLGDIIEKKVLNPWNIQTIETMGLAGERAPVASGTLEGSQDFLKAKVTATGIQSAILFKVPYAKLLNQKAPKSKLGRSLILKNPGELSYRVNKTRVEKQRKGEFAFLTKQTEEDKSIFTKIVSIAVSKGWFQV